MDSTDLKIKALHDEAARLLASNKDEAFIIDMFTSKGYERSYAEMVLENVRSDRFDRKQFYKHLFGGLFVLLAGATLTLGSYALAAPGSMFFIFTGIMLYGTFAVTRAIILFRK